MKEHEKDCTCASCRTARYTEYENQYMNEFASRCESFPRKSIILFKQNVLKVETEHTYEGYAWIGAAVHNTEHGCKGVDYYNYMLVEPRCLFIYFNEYNNDKQKGSK